MSLAERLSIDAAGDPDLARLLAGELVAVYDLLDQALTLALRSLAAPASPSVRPEPADLFDQLTFWAQLLEVDRVVFRGTRELEHWIAEHPTGKVSPIMHRRVTIAELRRALSEARPVGQD